MISIIIPQELQFLSYTKKPSIELKKSNVQKELDIASNFVTIPDSIYKKTFDNLLHGKIANVILNMKDQDGKCYWVFTAYSKNKANEVDVVFSEILEDCENLKQIKTLYQKLNAIEKKKSITVAKKYLEGYLEYKCTTLNEMVSYYSLTA